MNELKEWLLDQISYWINYDPTFVCFGPSLLEAEIRKKVYQEVLDKLRKIDKNNTEENLGNKQLWKFSGNDYYHGYQVDVISGSSYKDCRQKFMKKYNKSGLGLTEFKEEFLGFTK